MSICVLKRVSAMTAAVALWLGSTGTALAEWEVNMPAGVTAISQEVYGLHMLIFGICCVIAVIVFGAMIYSLIKHRRSLGVKPASFSHSTKAEIIWTIIPILILVGMAVPAADTLVRMEDTRNSDITVKVTAYQWKWHYDYIDHGVGFFSNLAASSNQARQLNSGIDPYEVDNYLLDVDNPLVVPVGAKVRLLLTASDVIHSWWVPDLGGKKDAIPGFVNEFWFKAEEPGIYRGQCAELCGRDHGFMPVVVNVVSEEEYDAWLVEQGGTTEVQTAAMDMAAEPVQIAMASAPAAAQPAVEWSMEVAMAEGETQYNASCAACHQVNGQGLPPTFPAIAGSPVATGDIAAHIDISVNGRPGTAMAAFGPQLSDEQLAAIVTYQRNAFGNDTGDLVKPADIAAAR
ncbi:MAG: cytochrome c oxidase subunit II [Gammaproteobacteria bacterium]|jgi:cytochrome c oxidase subunit 2